MRRYSDILLQTDIETIENAVETLSRIRGISFRYKDKAIDLGIIPEDQHTGRIVHTDSVGIIAQELANILPAAVEDSPDGYKVAYYDLLIPVLVQAIQELNERLKALEPDTPDDDIYY